MGVTGAYLISKLSDDHEVTGYERQKEKDFTAVCAWGTTKNELAEFASDCNLDFEDYLYHDGQKMEVIIEDKNNTKEDKLFIELNGLCTYNKAQLEHDMMKGHNVIFNKNVKLEEIYDDYDLIIDSTGLRAILPMSKNRIMIPCLEYRIKYKKRPYEDFFIKPFKGLTGYFWYFPLNENEAHVGAGDFYKKHNTTINEFMNKYPGEIINKIGRPICITPPSLCEPMYVDKVVGVGEAIGTVFPMLGEGIIPGLQCARLLIENLHDLKSYREKVLEFYSPYDSVFKVVNSKLRGQFKFTNNFLDVLKMYRFMKQNEKRFGMNIKLLDMFKVIRTV